MITIRQAKLPDAALIADLSRSTFFDTFSPFNTEENMKLFMDTQFTRGQLMAELLLPLNHFFIAYVDNEVAGYVRLRENNNPPELAGEETLEVARLYAVKEQIGKGVGEALMQLSIDLAMQLNKQTLWLGVWTENARAIKFYHRWGFVKFADHVFMLGNDAQQDWLMKRPVIAFP